MFNQNLIDQLCYNYYKEIQIMSNSILSTLNYIQNYLNEDYKK